MKLSPDALAAWLNLQSRPELSRAVLRSRAELTLPQVKQLTARMDALGPAEHTLRIGIVHTYTSDLLDPWLKFESAVQGMHCNLYHGPYGVLLQEAQPGTGLVRHDPELTVLLLQREDLHPDLRRPLSGLESGDEAKLLEQSLDRLAMLVARYREQVGGLLVVTLLPRMSGPGLGLFDCHSDRSESAWWARFKTQLAARLRAEVRSSLFLDLDEILAECGRSRFFDLRFWYSSAFPFAPDAARELARRIIALGAVTKYPRVKVIALDADNTLWGGVIGEDGLGGIALGPDYPGIAFVAFQRRLLDYQQRGFILALCSKNNPADVEQVLDQHPHQLLRNEHFAARRVNWESKPRNLVSLAQELNIGLSSFVFVDDSDHECAVVRHELPEVEVVQVPGNPVELPMCLDRVPRLEILSLTAEDRTKTRLYSEERKRREQLADIKSGSGDIEEYLRSLKMRMQVSFDDPSQFARLTQLTQKTNQFNLTTRRYQEQQMQEFIVSPDYLVAHFSLSDTFGDSGVVGLAVVRKLGGGMAEFDTFLMSCRVIGRRAETAFLEAVLKRLASEGITELVADFLPTSKNAPASGFLADSGFRQQQNGRFVRYLDESPPGFGAAPPIYVEITTPESAA
jgi:FkbH-like protein